MSTGNINTINSIKKRKEKKETALPSLAQREQ
jgi:hypothetical protein